MVCAVAYRQSRTARTGRRLRRWSCYGGMTVKPMQIPDKAKASKEAGIKAKQTEEKETAEEAEER